MDWNSKGLQGKTLASHAGDAEQIRADGHAGESGGEPVNTNTAGFLSDV